MVKEEKTTHNRTLEGLPNLMESTKKLCSDYFRLGFSQALLHSLTGKDIKPDELFEELWNDLS